MENVTAFASDWPKANAIYYRTHTFVGIAVQTDTVHTKQNTHFVSERCRYLCGIRMVAFAVAGVKSNPRAVGVVQRPISGAPATEHNTASRFCRICRTQILVCYLRRLLRDGVICDTAHLTSKYSHRLGGTFGMSLLILLTAQHINDNVDIDIDQKSHSS